MKEGILDYTKYRLKPPDELARLVEGVDRIRVVHCQKCFRPYREDKEPECLSLAELLGPASHKLAGCTQVDFLCQPSHAPDKFSFLEERGEADAAIGVIACGLGVQLVARLFPGTRVLALTDTIPRGGNATCVTAYHGIALGAEKCAACDQCYLDLTGGICPVVNCAKSLLNGPCGGAREGRCEVDPERNCAWIDIYERLGKQGRTFSGAVINRDFNRFAVEEREEVSRRQRERREEGFFGGVYPREEKEKTAGIAVVPFPEPPEAVIFLSQHVGSRAKPLVKEGDRVKRGQKLGEATGFISVPVHASVSGQVVALEERTHPAFQKPSLAVVIANDRQNRLDESVQPFSGWEKASGREVAAYLQEKGLVGLGGAAFPSHVKLLPPKPLDTLLINGCECEPFLNADNRLMIESPREVLAGVMLLRKILEVDEVVIGVEENKPEAIASLRENLGDFPGFTLQVLKTKYPQGAERMLVKRTLSRAVPEGGLPLEVGVAVFNVGTALAAYRAVFHGLPLIERVITLTGGDKGAAAAGNFLVKIGTPLKEIMAFVMGRETAALPAGFQVKMGGPMMGVLQQDIDSATVKGTTGFTVLNSPAVELSADRECIKCGRCVEVCPMELYPLHYARYGQREQWDECRKHKVKNCIECGCCDYVCSSKIALTDLIRKAKKNVDNQD